MIKAMAANTPTTICTSIMLDTTLFRRQTHPAL